MTLLGKCVNPKKEDSLISENQENFLLLLSESANYAQLMVEIIAFSSGYKIILNTGSYYRTLAQLLEKKMIKRIYPSQVKNERNSDKRQYYEITDKGIKALEYKREFRKKLVENSKQMTIDLSTL